MPHRAAADIRFAHAGHRDGGLDAGIDADLLERILHRERVHHRREHAHVIGGAAVEAFGGAGDAAEDVASANDEAQLMPGGLGGGNLAREAGHGIGIDPELAVAHQRFARQLEENPVKSRAVHVAVLSSRGGTG